MKLNIADIIQLHQRVKRGIPAWERQCFIENIVPKLLDELLRLYRMADKINGVVAKCDQNCKGDMCNGKETKTK